MNVLNSYTELNFTKSPFPSNFYLLGIQIPAVATFSYHKHVSKLTLKSIISMVSFARY